MKMNMMKEEICGDVNSWIRVAHEIHKHWSHTNNGDSTVYGL
jgi:hypothetical protein